ncbi:MAG: chemotaxis-specific protein-glutamate methyltransferase CheB [Candidatus Riflebacteria bacterium]|nr:chemotaxis-specific protein-glutamate methyltransferase CheB [Candidatus Riflebacteria bacterium]
MTLKVLVVEDSSVFRRIIINVLSGIPNVEVIGSAMNGQMALKKIQLCAPDLITLDLSMPEMDGFQFLDAIKRISPSPAVIVISASTNISEKLTLKAFEKGVLEFISKNFSGGIERTKEELFKLLSPLIQAFQRRLEIRKVLSSTKISPKSPYYQQSTTGREKPKVPPGSVAERMRRIESTCRAEMLLIGVSTGGPTALATLLPMIPKDINIPIFIVQHMPSSFTQLLAENLNAKCQIRIKQAVHREIAKPNYAYIAPGGQHLGLTENYNKEIVMEISDDPPENNCKPAVDYLFRSAAKAFPGKSVVVILTGMGHDGTAGLKLLKEKKCYAIAQDEESCVVFGMPKAAIDASLVDEVLPLDLIANEVYNFVKKR